MTIENTLEERGARYGSFSEHAKIAMAIKRALRIFPEKFENLPDVVAQAFDVIADKMARSLNGDPYYDDNYHDIIGYAKLAEDWVKKQKPDLLELLRYKDDGPNYELALDDVKT